MRHSYFTVPLIVVLILALVGLACGGGGAEVSCP